LAVIIIIIIRLHRIDEMQAIAISNPSICQSVRHTGEQCKNG